MCYTCNIQQHILAKIFELVFMGCYQCLHCIAGCPIRQHTDHMAAKFALLDAVVVEKAKDIGVFLAAIYGHQQFKHFFFMTEHQVLSVLCLLCRLRSEQLVERIFHTVLLQHLHLAHGALVDIEGESHHLGKSEVGIVPFVDIVLV